jgi:hypothetical protein
MKFDGVKAFPRCSSDMLGCLCMATVLPPPTLASTTTWCPCARPHRAAASCPAHRRVWTSAACLLSRGRNVSTSRSLWGLDRSGAEAAACNGATARWVRRLPPAMDLRCHLICALGPGSRRSRAMMGPRRLHPVMESRRHTRVYSMSRRSRGCTPRSRIGRTQEDNVGVIWSFLFSFQQFSLIFICWKFPPSNGVKNDVKWKLRSQKARVKSQSQK